MLVHAVTICCGRHSSMDNSCEICYKELQNICNMLPLALASFYGSYPLPYLPFMDVPIQLCYKYWMWLGVTLLAIVPQFPVYSVLQKSTNSFQNHCLFVK